MVKIIVFELILIAIFLVLCFVLREKSLDLEDEPDSIEKDQHEI